jgi:hypothetical protein
MAGFAAYLCYLLFLVIVLLVAGVDGVIKVAKVVPAPKWWIEPVARAIASLRSGKSADSPDKVDTVSDDGTVPTPRPDDQPQ